jgi:hypothetical protein
LLGEKEGREGVLLAEVMTGTCPSLFETTNRVIARHPQRLRGQEINQAVGAMLNSTIQI